MFFLNILVHTSRWQNKAKDIMLMEILFANIDRQMQEAAINPCQGVILNCEKDSRIGSYLLLA